MARVKGGDVLLQLMDTVAQLKKTAEQHAEQLEGIAKLGIETSTRVEGLGTHTFGLGSQARDLSKRMDDLSNRMDDMSTRMDDMSTRMDDMSTRMDDMSTRMDDMSSRTSGLANGFDSLATRVTALEEDLELQAQNFVEASKTARTHVQQLGRLARLLGELADGSERRFVKIEGRITALEKKSG
jgi:methyl-accepting chemotaxis protein